VRLEDLVFERLKTGWCCGSMVNIVGMIKDGCGCAVRFGGHGVWPAD
jgi:hypothetical protein